MMTLLYILILCTLILSTVMLVVFFKNDIERKAEIDKLNRRLSYYIKVLKDRGEK